MTQVFSGIPWNIPWNSMELWCRQMKYHLVPSMELWGCHFNQFHVRSTGLPWNIPWNYMELWSGQIKNHQDPSDAMGLGWRHFKWHKCSMEFHDSMEFHGTLVPPNEISLNSMEFHGTLEFHSMLPWTCMGYSMEFNGTLESPNKKSPSSMGFHGIRRAPFQLTQVEFHATLASFEMAPS